jgi:hypothetical protein
VRHENDVAGIRYCAGALDEGGNTYNVLDVVLSPGVPAPDPSLERNFYTTSSCGLCGKASLGAVRSTAGLCIFRDQRPSSRRSETSPQPRGSVVSLARPSNRHLRLAPRSAGRARRAGLGEERTAGEFLPDRIGAVDPAKFFPKSPVSLDKRCSNDTHCGLHHTVYSLRLRSPQPNGVEIMRQIATVVDPHLSERFRERRGRCRLTAVVPGGRRG